MIGSVPKTLVAAGENRVMESSSDQIKNRNRQLTDRRKRKIKKGVGGIERLNRKKMKRKRQTSKKWRYHRLQRNPVQNSIGRRVG